MTTTRNFLSGLGLVLGQVLLAGTLHAAPIASPLSAGDPATAEATLDDPCSKFGPDEATAKQEYSLYREFYKQDNFVDAISHWRYIYRNAPGLSKNTFTNGSKMYQDMADAATDTTVKQAYVDTLIAIYRKRIECYGDEGKVLGYLAYDLYKYRSKRYQAVYNAFKEAYDAEGEGVGYWLAYPFFQYNVLLYNDGKLKDDDLLAAFDRLIGYADANINAAEATGDTKTIENWQATKAKVEEILPRDLLTCSKLVERLERDRAVVFEDLNQLKKAYNNLKLAAADSSGNRCSDQPIFEDVVIRIVELEPENATLLTEAGSILWGRNDRDGAMSMWDKAIEMEDEGDKKAELAMTIARVFQREKRYGEARSYARKAISYRGNWGAPYILIGDLYASSGSICGGIDGEIAALAALDKYSQAKSVDPGMASEAQERINKYSQYMPTKTYLFERNLNEGSPYTYGCWIGETTTLRGKKSD
jgi:tetratricopeptide (TPR) repeat protein